VPPVQWSLSSFSGSRSTLKPVNSGLFYLYRIIEFI